MSDGNTASVVTKETAVVFEHTRLRIKDLLLPQKAQKSVRAHTANIRFHSGRSNFTGSTRVSYLNGDPLHESRGKGHGRGYGGCITHQWGWFHISTKGLYFTEVILF